MSEQKTRGSEHVPLHKTTALCPDCLRELPADVYADAEGVVWMERSSCST